MAGPRSSNLARSEWNKKCRERLSQHIQNKLGILIEPSQVRLKPNPDDVYSWEKMDDKGHLFSKNISDHSIRALKELYREVGQSFEVVENRKSDVFRDGSISGLHCPKESNSYRSRIDELENCLTEQTSEIRHWKSKADFEAKMREQAEKKLSESERMIQVMLGDRQRLEQHVEDWKIIAEQCEERRQELDQAVRKILHCLKDVQLELDS
ncbi:hypothetical protein OIDMADRAFT_61938 [Oidiodendron maius Zn]|uniref:Uncharacterized protein n=1 Tax=Oidiodendron maius (strain Zn) TaxID=913774 RepID=A0A0C3CU00_OIDMZ|nr:hypothetical protein OIDMADRAFT_61938 [Oidiodendron maius Zn]